MNNWTFLHLNSGFWLIGFPVLAIWICSHLFIREKEKHSLNEVDDFIDIKEIDEIELYTMEFKVNKEERWKIGQVLKRAEYKNVDDLVRSSLYEMIK